MKWLCTKDLTMAIGVLSFTKDESYEEVPGALISEPGMNLVDNQGFIHEVNMVEEHGSWLQYFIKPESNTFAEDILASILEEEMATA